MCSVVLTGIVQDITDRRKAEEAVRESEEKFSKAFYLTPALMALVDEQTGVYVEVNETFCTALGLRKEEVIGLTPEQAGIHGLDGALDSAFQVIRRQGFLRGHEMRMQLKSGEVRTGLFSADRIHLQSRHLLITVLNDITERKLAEEQVQRVNLELERRVAQRTAELSDLYNHAPCGYHSLDENGMFVIVNETECQWLGYAADEIAGKMKFTDIATSDSCRIFLENFPTFKKQGWIKDLEFELIRKDGSTFRVLLNASSIVDAAGRYLMSRSTMVDITKGRVQRRLFLIPSARRSSPMRSWNRSRIPSPVIFVLPCAPLSASPASLKRKTAPGLMRRRNG